MSAPPLPTTPAPTGNGVSVISFDPQAFHEADEAELQQEETVRQNELCELLTHEFDDEDFDDEESILSQTDHHQIRSPTGEERRHHLDNLEDTHQYKPLDISEPALPLISSQFVDTRHSLDSDPRFNPYSLDSEGSDLPYVVDRVTSAQQEEAATVIVDVQTAADYRLLSPNLMVNGQVGLYDVTSTPIQGRYALMSQRHLNVPIPYSPIQPIDENFEFQSPPIAEIIPSMESVEDRQSSKYAALYEARGCTVDDLKVKVTQLTDTLDEERRINTHRLVLKDAELCTAGKDAQRYCDQLTDADELLANEKLVTEQLRGRLQKDTLNKDELIQELKIATETNEELSNQLSVYSNGALLTSTRNQHHDQIEALKNQHCEVVVALQTSLDDLTRESRLNREEANKYREIYNDLHVKNEKDMIDRNDIVTHLTVNIQGLQHRIKELLVDGNAGDLDELRIAKYQLQDITISRDMYSDLNTTLQAEIHDLKKEVCMYESSMTLLQFQNTPKLGDIGIDFNESLKDVNFEMEKGDSEDVLKLKRCLSQVISMHKTKCTSYNDVETQLAKQKTMLEELHESRVIPKPIDEIDYSSEVRDLQDQVKADKIKISQLNNDMTSLIDSNDTNTRDAVNRYVSEADNHLTIVSNQLRDQLTASHDSVVQSLKLHFSKDIDRYEHELDEAKTMYTDICLVKDEAIEDLEVKLKQNLKDKFTFNDILELQVKNLKTQNKQYIDNCNVMLGNKENLELKFTKLKENNEQYIQERKNMCANKDNLELQVNNLKDKNEQYIQERKNMCVNKDKLESQVNNLKGKNKQYIQECKNMFANKDELELQVNNLKGKNEQYIQECNNMRANKNNLMTEVNSLKAQILKFDEDKRIPLKDVTTSDIPDTLERCQTEVGKLRTSNQSLMTLVICLRKKCGKFKEDLYESTLSNNVNNDDHYIENINKLQNSIIFLNEEIKKITVKYEKEKKDLILNNNDLIKQVRKDNDDFHVTFLNENKISYEELRTDGCRKLEEEKKKYEKSINLKIKNFEEKIDKMKLELETEYEEKMDDIVWKISPLQVKIKEYEVLVKEQTVKIKEQSNDKNEYVVELKDMMYTNNLLEEYNRDVTSQYEEAKTTIVKLKTTKKDNESVITELTTHLKRYRKQNMSSRKADKRVNSSTQTPEITTHSSKKVSVHNHYKAIINDIRAEMTNHMTKINVLSEKQLKKRMESECQKLTQRLQSYHMNSLNELLDEDFSSQNFSTLRKAVKKSLKTRSNSENRQYKDSVKMLRTKSLTNLLDKSEQISDILRMSVNSECDTSIWDSTLLKSTASPATTTATAAATTPSSNKRSSSVANLLSLSDRSLLPFSHSVLKDKTSTPMMYNNKLYHIDSINL